MRSSCTAAAVVVSLVAADAAGQSLGSVAAAEAARRQAITAPARVVTQDDLPQGPPAPIPDAAPPADGGSDPDTANLVRTAARLRGGAAPAIPVQAVGAGEVALEVRVSASGTVTDIAVLRTTAPFTEAMSAAVRGWRFEPAIDTSQPTGEGASPVKRPVASSVLVLGVFRPPALFGMTIGTPPATVSTPTDAVPAPRAFPPLPTLPPNVMFDGVVMAELRVGADGALAQTSIVQSSPAFDGPTLDAVSALSFFPARAHGKSIPAFVYVVAGFRQPVTP